LLPKCRRKGKKRWRASKIWNDLIYEAEWHAVWQDQEENLIDITPREPEDKVIMFVPVDNVVYHGQFIDNIRINITNNPIVDHFILISECIQLLLSKAERLNEEEISIPPQLQLPVRMFTSFLLWQRKEI
jgi:hypothetical protein